MCKVRAWDLGFGVGKRRAGLGQDAVEPGSLFMACEVCNRGHGTWGAGRRNGGAVSARTPWNSAFFSGAEGANAGMGPGVRDGGNGGL